MRVPKETIVYYYYYYYYYSIFSVDVDSSLNAVFICFVMLCFDVLYCSFVCVRNLCCMYFHMFYYCPYCCYCSTLMNKNNIIIII
jgi:hypothetical protein